MSKSITKKLIYVVVVMAMLAMMIPMAIPVSAAGGTIAMYLVDPITHLATVLDSGYNIAGSTVEIRVTGDTLKGWDKTDWAGTTSEWVPNVYPGTATTVRVKGVWGESTITALSSDDVTEYSVDKKWGQITNTVITSPGSTYVTWNEEAKAWSGTATITDTVNGIFKQKDNSSVPHVVQGAILNWYLVPSNVVVPTQVQVSPGVWSMEAGPLKAAMLALTIPGPTHVNFAAPYSGHTAVTATGAAGTSTVGLTASGEESVKIVIVPEYPGPAQLDVDVEVTSWDFWTTEMEVVPQVRWAGEKIVLEKHFGDSFNGQWVKFNLQNQSVGALEGITGLNNTVNNGSVWTQVANGFASVILVSSDAGVGQVTAGLYAGTVAEPGALINQHFFTVYFLKFESLTLGDVQGKRTGHNSGPWELIPGTLLVPGVTNPWDPSGSYNGTRNPTVADNATQSLNVSQDALLRARVKGWFTSNNPSVRPVRTIDPANSTLNDPGTATLTLPQGRWILPDDWAALAGPNWQQSRMHWDIMCKPDGSVGALNNPLGSYYMPPLSTHLVGAANVIGPFSPGLELMTPIGWTIPNPGYDSARPINTVVPDGLLTDGGFWDAPMPAAKIIFQVQNVAAGVTSGEAGYFKATNKADVYYINTASGVVYTNPFYQAYIPAHEAIPAFINNGGYDWDSFDVTYGPYMFWEFINQNRYVPQVVSTDPANHPTVVEVYSDNHGEAMVWLNGNWNLNLMPWLYQGSSVDIPSGTPVGMTTIQATADYPYSRLHQAVQSNLDVKTWIWGQLGSLPGQQVLGTDTHTFSGTPSISTVTADTRMVLSVGNYDMASVVGTFPNQAARSTEKMVWVWITDRDNTRTGVTGARINWSIGATVGAGAKIATTTGQGISGYNTVTQNIWLDNGFLAGTSGMILDGAARLVGTSVVRIPTSFEVQLFNKFWGSPVANPANPQGTSTIRADAANYLVAGLKVISESGYASRVAVNIEITSHDFDLYMGQLVAGTVRYETDVDFNVIDALDDGIRTGDANCDGAVNMGDVTAVERMILGYSTVTSNAILNNDGTVDMGTVVKIERTILGLK